MIGSPLCNAAGKLLCHPASGKLLWKISGGGGGDLLYSTNTVVNYAASGLVSPDPLYSGTEGDEMWWLESMSYWAALDTPPQLRYVGYTKHWRGLRGTLTAYLNKQPLKNGTTWTINVAQVQTRASERVYFSAQQEADAAAQGMTAPLPFPDLSFWHENTTVVSGRDDGGLSYWSNRLGVTFSATAVYTSEPAP